MIHSRWKLLVGFLLLSIALVACSGGTNVTDITETPLPEETNEGLTIVLGDISDDPGEVIEGTQPLANYIAFRLGDYGITAGSVRIAADADEMIALLKDGEIDLYFDSVYPATLIGDASGAQPILRRWRFGVEEYHTVIFVSADSGITSLDDLAGHMIAFDNPFSTSGFLLPSVYLTESNLSLVGKDSYNDQVEADELGFVFSYDDDNTLQWVLSGFTAAGATDNVHYDLFFPDEAKENLIVLAETESIPRQVVMARPGLDPDLLVAIIDILTTMHEDEEGEAALEPFQTSRFDEFPGGIEVTLERMREMMLTVQDIPLP